MDYPHILITTSLSDTSLFDEPAKFTAKLRDYKTDNNLLLLKLKWMLGMEENQAEMDLLRRSL